MRIPIYSEGRTGHYIGYVENEWFVKKINEDGHFLTAPPAIAYNVAAMVYATEVGATILKVICKDTSREWQCAIDSFHRHCFILERGHGEQIGLGLQYWSISGQPRQGQLF